MRILEWANLSTRVLCVSLAVALGLGLGACATAGEGSDNPDGGRTDGPNQNCGNNSIDPGEACDGANLNGQDCQSQGFDDGILACNVTTCSFATDNCYRCGDGAQDGAEQCDGADLAGATCQSLGYLGGTLACAPGTCAYDISGCQTSETLTNDDGVCNTAIGCSNGTGTSGNPQSLVECFRGATMQPPFWLAEIGYEISSLANDPPPPAAMNIEVYSWSGTGPPGTLAGSQPVPANGLNTGRQTITLSNPIEITTQDFCVGLNGTDPNDGFRLLFSETSQEFGVSYFVASICGIDNFDAVANIVGPGNWCITATIDKVAP
jgi:hypothetical protein